MATMNADEVIGTVEVTIGAKTYILGKVTQAKLDALTPDEASEDDGSSGADAKPTSEILAEQIGLLLDEPAETFRDEDVRKLGVVIKYLTAEILAHISGESGNPTEGEAGP